MNHKWSGWPGAYCMSCGKEDATELAVAGEPHEVHHRYSAIMHVGKDCEGCAFDSEPCIPSTQPTLKRR